MSKLSSIEGIGKDFQLNAGFCYKEGQSVPAGIGGPHLRIKELRIMGAVYRYFTHVFLVMGGDNKGFNFCISSTG